MAIIKFNNRKKSSSKGRTGKLQRILDYITDLKKTCTDLIGGNGVNKDNAFDRMNIVKDYYNKKAGREYIHFVVSFKGKQDADIVYGIAERICMLYADYQVLFSVHLNTRNTHIHFVLNTVSVKDGHKYSQSKADMQNLKKCIESIISQSGLLYEEIYESDYYDDEEDDFEYPEESELIDPIIPFDGPKLSEMWIPLDELKPSEMWATFYGSELIERRVPLEEPKLIEGWIPLDESELIEGWIPLD